MPKTLIRMTKQRRRVLEVLSQTKKSLTAEDVYQRCKDVLDLSTVYRTLNTLAEAGEINRFVHEDRKTYFKPISDDNAHEHRLVCSECNNVVNFEVCPFTGMQKEISSQTGFKIKTHNVELTGICPNCNDDKT